MIDSRFVGSLVLQLGDRLADAAEVVAASVNWDEGSVERMMTSGRSRSRAPGFAAAAAVLCTARVLDGGPERWRLNPRVTAASLVVFTAAMTMLFHRFWEAGAATRPVEQAAFIANLGITAGLLIYFVSGPGAWSWQGWWRSLRGGEARPAPAKKRAQRVPRPA